MSTSTTAALQGTGSGSGGSSISSNNAAASAALPLEDFHFSSSQLLALHDSKHDAIQVLKSDLLDELNKEVKSLDEDSWMFEGPRSRINSISKPGSYFLSKSGEFSNKWNQGRS
ncbi:hypothetical protein RND81_08G144500 [Saponaria officinalis]|uniref:Uncharacterized protein n=1 Tax=Saponaria officinalis TaxID=3572 RepID=A0AAW1J7Q1_SAPOF